MDKRLGSLIYTKKHGMSFIEVMIALVIIGIMASVAIGLLQTRTVQLPREKLLDELNIVLAVARNHAILYQTDQRIVWDFGHKKISIHYPSKELMGGDQHTYTQKNSCFVPSFITPVEFLVNGIDELAQAGKKVTQGWFFISKQGFSQPVIINCFDKSENPPQPFSIVVNPFNAQCKMYGSFQK